MRAILMTLVDAVMAAVAVGSAAAAPPKAALKGPIVASFTVTKCANQGESDLVLKAKRLQNYSLSLSAKGGRGSLRYIGGGEEDGIDMRGTVKFVVVGDDGSFTVKGTWKPDGKAFSLKGNCPA